MDKKKIFILAILAIFCIGMSMSAVSASHTYNVKGYKFTVDTKTYNKILKLKKTHKRSDSHFDKIVPTNKYKKLKVKFKSGYKYKKYVKYYQIYRNGKSLGKYFRFSKKPTANYLSSLKKTKADKITYKKVYATKKVPVYKIKYISQRVCAVVGGYLYKWDSVKDKGDYRPLVTFRTFPSNNKYQYLTMFFGTNAWL